MSYFGELLQKWRPLTAAFIGLAVGMSIAGYIQSIMAPHLLKEFGWTRSEFAMINSLALIGVFVFPVAGRLADVWGVRRTALIGVALLPLSYVALAFQPGSLWFYGGIFVIQSSLCITTTSAIYTRVVVQYIERARGLALGIVAAGPAVAGLVGSPALNAFVVNNGWRSGYILLAVVTALLGALAILMIPTERRAAAEAPAAERPHKAKKDYALILRHPAFWLLVVALFLVNLPQTIVLTQINLLMESNGVNTADAGVMLSAFAGGMLAGRLICGVAIDHFPAHLVAAISLMLPSIGLFTIASDFDAPVILTLSLLAIGLAYGAEGDLMGYLVVRIFGVGIYSSVMGLLTMINSLTTSIGAALLALTLALSGEYFLFLMLTGTTVFIGALSFLLLPVVSRRSTEPEHALAGAE